MGKKAPAGIVGIVAAILKQRSNKKLENEHFRIVLSVTLAGVSGTTVLAETKAGYYDDAEDAGN